MSFFATNKNVTVTYVGTSKYVELDISTTLPFYIIEAVQDTEITEVSYKILKASGRTPEELQSWTALPVIQEDVYEFDVLVTGVTSGTDLTFQFKIVDVDGIEAFVDVPAFKVI